MNRKYTILILSALLLFFFALPGNMDARKKSKTKAKTEQTSSSSSKKKSSKKKKKDKDSDSSSKKKKKKKNSKKEDKKSSKSSRNRKASRNSSGASNKPAATRAKRQSKPRVTPEVAQNDSLTIAVNAAVLKWVPAEQNPGGLRVNSVTLDKRLHEAKVGLNDNFTYLPINQHYIAGL